MFTNPSPPRFFRKTSIRTKLRLSAAVTIGLALAVAFTVSLQYRNVSQAARTERFAHSVIKDVSDLNSLSYEYLLLEGQAAWGAVAVEACFSWKGPFRARHGER